MGRLIHLVFSQGERYPVFIDEDGIPDFWITLYVTEILRVSLKQTAIENTIRNLTHLKLWEEMNQRDLVSEFSQAKFLSEADIYSIRDHCLLSTRDLREWLELKEKMNVSKLRVSNPTNMSHLQSVSKLHSGNRLVHIASYLHFTARSMLRMRPNFTSLTVQIDEMKKLLIAQKPKGLGGKGLTTDPDSKAPPPEVFEKLMSVIKVDSPDNPYKNQSIRLRNSLMFEVLYETGMRSGEVLGLQIGDVDFQENKISIVRRHDNPDDPRKRQPVAKTLERDIPVNTNLVRRLRNYVMDVRSKMITAKTPPFLFITHKRGRYQGHPLSESTFRNRVLGPVTAANPELFEEVTRHGFRHNFNYRLSQKIDAINQMAKTDPSIKPISAKEEIQIRKHLNGWSSDTSAERYNLRHIRELANKLMREDMHEMSGYLNKSNK